MLYPLSYVGRRPRNRPQNPRDLTPSDYFTQTITKLAV